MKIGIIIPTYNEYENVNSTYQKIMSATKNSLHQFSVIFADDYSPDNTGQKVQELMTKHNNVYLNSGPRQGIGQAYLRAFEYAKNHHQFDAVVMFDADLSHDPHAIKRMIKKLENGYDTVIGSRGLASSGLPGNWPMKRILNTKIANWVARHIAGIRGIKDKTSGFRLIKTELLDDIIKHAPANASGYVFMVYLSHLFTNVLNLKIAEIPITFRNRTKGSSKIRFKDVKQFFHYCLTTGHWSREYQLIKKIIILAGICLTLLTIFDLTSLRASQSTLLISAILFLIFVALGIMNKIKLELWHLPAYISTIAVLNMVTLNVLKLEHLMLPLIYPILYLLTLSLVFINPWLIKKKVSGSD